MVTHEDAVRLLTQATDGRATSFMDGQWEAIEALVNRRRRVLLVQRTGWGKSMVYFLATKILRDSGAGPTLIISPLLALMRNQQDAANRLGLKAETVNSSNQSDWNDIFSKVTADAVDLLLVSPERLSNQDFVDKCLSPIAEKIALFVVDEAHCISDWGHDFRPDYQRIDRLLRNLPKNIAVLAATATANNRVVEDVKNQLGKDTDLHRGELSRRSLSLQAIRLPDRASRLAWLATAIPKIQGSGIVYTLTVRDAENVAFWLNRCGIAAEPYHGQINEEADGGENGDKRAELEQRLLKNELKVLVATSALGMGFDKPDLAFVIHFQAPQSIVHYYQQVGRAGRAISSALGIMLVGSEDDEINQHFIGQAFPPEADVNLLLAALSASEGGLTAQELTKTVNLRKGQIEKVLKYLAVGRMPSIAKVGTSWTRTANPQNNDRPRIQRLTLKRQQEWQDMVAYSAATSCLMKFLCDALDDPNSSNCGKCSVCLGTNLVEVGHNQALLANAIEFCKKSELTIDPRKRWQTGAFPEYGFRGNIAREHQNEEGRALGFWQDSGWGKLVEEGKRRDRFGDELVAACADLISARWRPEPVPRWVTCVPSLRSPTLVPDFSARLAATLGIPFRPAVKKVKETKRQRNMMNSWQQAVNLDGAFAVDVPSMMSGPVLLIDDIIDSGWSLTVIGALLLRSGASKVFPLVLASASAAG